MAENHLTQSNESPSEHQTAPPPPWSSLLSLVERFKLHKFFPWTLNFANNRQVVGFSGDDKVGVERSAAGRKPDVVKLAEPKPVTPPPLKVEAGDPARISSPLVDLPVYAIGGFIVLKWVVARWKERQERAKKPDDDNPSTGGPPDDDE